MPTAALAAGVWLGIRLPDCGPGLLGIALGCALLALLPSLDRLAFAAWFPLGAGFAALGAPVPVGDHPIDPWLSGQAVLITGRVRAPPRLHPDGSWAVEVDLVEPAPGRVRLRASGEDVPAPGDGIAARARLRPPRVFDSPGQRDRLLREQRTGLRGNAYPFPADAVVVIRGPPRALDEVREIVRSFLAVRLDDPTAGIALALVLGDRSRLEPGLRDHFRRTGTSHLLAISGLHVGIVAWVVGITIRWLAALVGPVRIRVSPRTAGVMAGLLAAIGYASLTGWAISTSRATAMAAVLALLLVARRPIDTIQVCAAAACALLLADPAVLWEPATALSFGSVVAIVRLTPPAGGHRLRTAAAGSAAAAVGTAPWTLGLFGELSLVSVPANLVAIPLLGMLLVPLLLAAVAIGGVWGGAGTGLLALADVVARAGCGILAVLGDPRWSPQLEATPPHALTTASVVLLTVAFCLPRRSQRWLGALAAAALSLVPWHPGAPPRGELTLTAFDVGHGDALLLSLPAGDQLLIDAGGRAQGLDPGSEVVVPALRRLGVDHLDAAVVSHLHLDHYGGMAAILTELTVDALWLPVPPESGHPAEAVTAAALTERVPIAVLAGQTLTGPRGGCRIEQLHPLPGHACPGGAVDCGANGHSAVIRIVHGDVAFLLTGDMEADLEWELTRAEVPLRAQVLKVPHHGSATSSSPPLLASVAPALAIASLDPRSRHKLPRPSVTHRYCGAGTVWRSTGSDGTIQVSTDGRRIRFRTFRVREGWSRWQPLPDAGAARSQPPPRSATSRR